MKVEFTVKGIPRPMPRPRGTIIPGPKPFIRVYSPKKDISGWWSRIKEAARENAPESLLVGPLYSSVTIWLERPKKDYYVRKDGLVLRDNVDPFPTTRGDHDNYLKAIHDAVQESECIFKNDNQIVMGRFSMLWVDPGSGGAVVAYTEI